MKTKLTLSLFSLLFSLLFSTTIWSQEKATIKGQITVNDNQSPENITVILKGTRLELLQMQKEITKLKMLRLEVIR